MHAARDGDRNRHFCVMSESPDGISAVRSHQGLGASVIDLRFCLSVVFLINLISTSYSCILHCAVVRQIACDSSSMSEPSKKIAEAYSDPTTDIVLVSNNGTEFRVHSFYLKGMGSGSTSAFLDPWRVAIAPCSATWY